jgi:hypothetical protein
MRQRVYLKFLISVYLVNFILPLMLYAEEKSRLYDKQTIYVPAYSHIYFGNIEKPFLLTITLSIRNIDPNHPVTIAVVDYYESQGERIKKLMAKPINLGPLESLRYVIPEKDKSGGSGANFLVEWESDISINPPIVETIMIGTRNQQGISFKSRGRPILPTKF